jgi:hypothetical protein
MWRVLGDKQPKDFGIPENIVFVDRESGKVVEPTGPMSRMACDAYLRGTEPKMRAAS